MIVKISGSGKSFSGLAQYLTHDPEKAQTANRVAWTHTHNLANDHVPSAVNEMYLTAENAELLKQQAGVRAGGRSTEHPAKHISLNWAIKDNPSERHMVATSEQFMRSMGWNEHQAIFVAHSDKKYKHLHLLINEVHPETGLKFNDAFEKVRAQEWAANYERERGVIRCEQRLLNPEDREKNIPRNMWVEFKQNEQEFKKSEDQLRQNSDTLEYSPENREKEEWKILKQIQRDERDQFFADGKIQFKELRKSISREIREEFRDKWAEYYQARKNGADAPDLAAQKAQLVGDQKALLGERREEAFGALREARDSRYQALLGQQREERAELRWHQEAGLDPAPFLSALHDRKDMARESAAQFHAAAHEFTARHTTDRPELGRSFDRGHAEPAHTPGRADKGVRVRAFGIGSFLDSLFVDLTGPGPRPPEPDPDAFQAAADDATRREQSIEYRSFDDERLARQKALGGD